MEFDIFDFKNNTKLGIIDILEKQLFDTAIFNLIKKLEKQYITNNIELIPNEKRYYYSHSYSDGILITTEADRNKWNELDYNSENTTEVILKYITSEAGTFAPAFNSETRKYGNFKCIDFDLSIGEKIN